MGSEQAAMWCLIAGWSRTMTKIDEKKSLKEKDSIDHIKILGRLTMQLKVNGSFGVLSIGE